MNEKHTYCCDESANGKECRHSPDLSESAESTGCAIDHFLHEMEEQLEFEKRQSVKFMNLGAWASADKSGARAECLYHVISRYKQRPK